MAKINVEILIKLDVGNTALGKDEIYYFKEQIKKIAKSIGTRAEEIIVNY